MTEVLRHENETTASVLRRFTKKVQQAGILSRAKKIRFRERGLSQFKKRKKALMRLKRKREIEKLQKLGKIKMGRNA